MNRESKASRALMAIDRAIAAGRIIVVAAGNYGPAEGTINSLAMNPKVICVGSANWEGTQVSSFSSRGIPESPSSGPTIIAPGENVISSWISNKPKTVEQAMRDARHITIENLRKQSGGEYERKHLQSILRTHTVMSGTSMACAHITGIMARFVEMCTTLGWPHTADDAVNFLRYVAKPIPGVGQHIQGFGFVSLAGVDEFFANM